MRRKSQSRGAGHLAAAVSLCLGLAGCAHLTPSRASAQVDGGPGDEKSSLSRASGEPKGGRSDGGSGARNYEAIYFEAQLQLAANDPEAALDLLKPLRDRSDCPPEILTAIADAYRLGRDPDSCLKALTEATERFPQYVPAWQQKAETNRRRGDMEGAVADMEKAVALEPDNTDMLERVGLWRLQTTKNWQYKEGKASPVGRILEIYNHLLELRAGQDRLMPYLVLTSVYTQIGEHDKAIESAKGAVSAKGSDIRAQQALAEAFEAAAKKKEALGAYRQALLIDPNNAAIRKKIVGLVASVGGPGGLLAFYEELAQSFPRVREIQESYGDELVKAEQWEKAAEHYKKALENWPDDLKFKSALVRAYFKLGREKEAIGLAQKLIEDPAVSNADLLQLSDSLRGAGKLEMVIDLLKRVAAAKKDDPRMALYLANVQIEAKRVDDAIKTLEGIASDLDALMARKPDGFLTVATLGKLYADAGKFEKAHELYDRAREKAAKDQATDLLLMKAQLYRQEKKNNEAIKILSGILESGGRVPETATRMLVDIYEASGSFAAAHEALDRYIAKADAPGAIQGRRLKAYLYWRSNEYAKAIEIMESLHTAQPGDMDILRFLAENYIDDGKLEKAMDLVDSAEGKVDDTLAAEIKLLKARIYKEQKKWPEALAILEGLMTENKEAEQFCLIAGDYYQQAGRLDDAEKVLRRAIEINPENPEPYNALGYFFAEAGQRLDEALSLVQKALEISPNQGHILDSLGWIYFKRGDYAKAVEALESAVRNMADAPDAIILEHLGDAYDKKGDSGKARQAWGESLKLNPKAGGVRDKLGK